MSGDTREAYFHINFADKPGDYLGAEMSIGSWSVPQTLNLAVCLIEES